MRPPSQEGGGGVKSTALPASRERLVPVETGTFGADIQLSMVKNGPVTLWLQLRPSRPGL